MERGGRQTKVFESKVCVLPLPLKLPLVAAILAAELCSYQT